MMLWLNNLEVSIKDPEEIKTVLALIVPTYTYKVKSNSAQSIENTVKLETAIAR